LNIIKNIKIKYFRSIYDLSLKKCKNLNIISGRNDAGKSNILRALNLFFNNQTDWNLVIDFYKDFSIQRLEKVREESIKGKQFISIEVEFYRPNSYRNSLPETFKVTKTWTRDSLIPKETNNFDALYRQGKLPKTIATANRSLSGLLNKIHFEYIPAIKDRIYFQHLLSRLQEALLEKPLQEEDEISTITENLAVHMEGQIQQLHEDFQRATRLDTMILPPKDFASLFQSFQVSTKVTSGSVPLQSRGDGLQARYVPSVLHYISSNSKKIFIWGFEEPENSLEYHHTSLLADDFANKYSNEAQIFMTSHSPAFVSLQESNVICFRAYQENGLTDIKAVWPTIQNDTHNELLREEIGILDIQKAVHKQYEKKLEELNNTRDKLLELETELAQSTKTLILTEGKTDKTILEEAWKKLYPNTEILFNIRDADTMQGLDGGTGGAQSVKTMIESIHPEDGRKAIALFDYDEEGINVFNKLSRNFKKRNGSATQKRHSNNFAYAVLLTVPSYRTVFEDAKNMCIEYMFKDDVLSKQTVDGRGLKIKKEKPYAAVKGKRVDVPQGLFDDVEIPGYDTIEAGKAIFADEIVPTLEREDFLAFEDLFTLFQEIADV
jgi:AAA15 family ATPase/GTPase